MQIETRLTPVEAGVANFRAFQLDATKKLGFVFGFSKAIAWATAIIGPILLAIFTWAMSQIIPAAKTILNDYYKRHPSALIQQNVISDSPGREYTASEDIPRDANVDPTWQNAVK